ncbi:hypothetical protein pipiens_019668, partial [Culex pipiens pipiens]
MEWDCTRVEEPADFLYSLLSYKRTRVAKCPQFL